MLVTGATGCVPASCAELLCAVFLISRSSSEWGMFQESFPGFGGGAEAQGSLLPA